jgi:hypothetical protein
MYFVTLRNHCSFLSALQIAIVQSGRYNYSQEERTAISKTTKIFHTVPLGGGSRQAAAFSPLAAYRVTYCIITQFSNGTIELVQLSALISPLHFHSLAAATALQCCIPWEISSYVPCLKQTYIQLTENSGMKFSGPELLNATIHDYQDGIEAVGFLTARVCSTNMFTIP